MSKYRKNIVEDIQAKNDFQESQRELKKKHHIDDAEEKIIVEKSSVFRTLVKVIGTLIRIAATIVIAALAIIGLAGLIYPAPRTELFKIGTEMYLQLSAWIQNRKRGKSWRRLARKEKCLRYVLMKKDSPYASILMKKCIDVNI